MPEPAILSLIKWLRVAEHPHYVLLPVAEYRTRWKAWSLPPPKLLGTFD